MEVKFYRNLPNEAAEIRRSVNVKELKTTNKKAMTNKPYNRQFLQGE